LEAFGTGTIFTVGNCLKVNHGEIVNGLPRIASPTHSKQGLPNTMLESFLALLDGEKPHQMVWTADITYWIAGRQQDGSAKPAWKTEEGYLQLHKELGILPYFYYEKFWASEPRYDSTVEVAETKTGDKTRRSFHTPMGELDEESIYSPVSCSWGITKHFVESEGDLDILRYLLEHRRLEPTNLADWPDRRKLWQAYDGVPSIGMPRSPLAAMMVEWAGVQNTSYLMLDARDKVVEILQRMEEQEGPIVDAVCDLMPPIVHFPDNLSSECTTGYYDNYMAAGHRRRIDRLHRAGVKCAVHLDGTVKGLLPKLERAGFDAIEALTPKPAGDLDVEEIRKLAVSDTLILWGGVPGVMFAPPHDWAQMESHVHRLIECWGNRPFIMGVADQVPPDGNIEFCRNIAAIVQ
jgi:hypothetical protein